jgi:ankyrin repeat protein
MPEEPKVPAPDSIDDRLFEAARVGQVDALTALLNEHPEKLTARCEPYGWTLLHAAARHLAAVDLLLNLGLDVNVRETGDNTYAMHWAAAAGRLEVVRRLADAGGDVVGREDDHDLEVIGWATCWDDCDDDAHRAVADFLVTRGARHHIFSAIALNVADEVRRIVADDPRALGRRQSRNENHRTPLQFAVLKNRPEMISLLLELGADPLAVDGSGLPVAAYATSPEIDRPVMERIRALTSAELASAARGRRPPRAGAMDLLALLALGDWAVAEQLARASPDLIEPAGGVLHLMSKRNDVPAVDWLLEHGANPNGRWAHWDAVVTPLHLAASRGHADVVRRLLTAGADPTIRDSKHDSDSIGWANFFRQPEIVEILQAHQAEPPPCLRGGGV